jgi:peptidoglycan/LPS O-acetylase OafA/YrhL
MILSMQPVAPGERSVPPRRLVHIRELDGVRGLAAIMVFFHHVCYTSIEPTGWNAPVRLLRTISISGMYGVDLFFVLSGFLITSLLIDARRDRSYYHDFYWKRALRILPLYTLCLLGVLLFIPGSRGYVLLSALFVSNFAWLFHIQGVGPFWTLAIEEQFYLLWPTVVRRRSVAQLRRWALSIGATAVLLRFIAAIFGHHDYDFTFFHCDGLAFGAFLACWFSSRGTNADSSARESRAIASGLFLGILFIVLSFGTAETQTRSAAFAAAFRLTGVTLVCGCIVAFLISHTGRRGLSFLRSRILTFFGLISYAMYMTHIYVMYAYDHLRGTLTVGDYSSYVLRFLAIFGITIALCLLTRYLVELPAMSLRKYVLAKPAPANPADPPLPLGNM